VRPLLSGLLVLVLLAGTGVTAALLLRPDLDSSPEAERAAATGLGERAVSLEGLRRAPAPGDEEPAPAGPPPKTTEVIGVGTGEFSGQAGGGDVEDVDGPADPRGGRDRLRRRDP
jgi:hypothetical protein